MLGFEAVCDEQVPILVKTQKVIVELPHLQHFAKFNLEIQHETQDQSLVLLGSARSFLTKSIKKTQNEFERSAGIKRIKAHQASLFKESGNSQNNYEFKLNKVKTKHVEKGTNSLTSSLFTIHNSHVLCVTRNLVLTYSEFQAQFNYLESSLVIAGNSSISMMQGI